MRVADEAEEWRDGLTVLEAIRRLFPDAWKEMEQLREMGADPILLVVGGPINPHEAKFSALSTKCQRDIEDMFKRGELYVTGIDPQDRPDAPPVRVSAERWRRGLGLNTGWQGRITDPDQTELIEGLPLIGIRVHRSEQAPPFQAQPIPLASPKTETIDDRMADATPVGRPSRVNEIDDAYDDLVKRGEIDFKVPQKRARRQVREEVMRRAGNRDSKGLEEEVIRKCIAKKFQAKKGK